MRSSPSLALRHAASEQLRPFLPVVLLCMTVVLFGAIVTGHRADPRISKALSKDSVSFWLDLDPSHVDVEAVRGPDGERALEVEAARGRLYFTFLQHEFKRPLDLQTRPYVLLNFRGTGSGRTFQFFVDFDQDSSAFALYEFEDERPGWRAIPLMRVAPDALKGTPDWTNVTRFRLGATDKQPRKFAVGATYVADPAS
jgi:hypothetical protein